MVIRARTRAVLFFDESPRVFESLHVFELPRGSSLFASALLAAAAMVLLGACIPAPTGECSRDADCTSSRAGFFCAEGLCQGPPLASIEVPAGPFARSGSITVTVHLTRAHGGPAGASAMLKANGQQTAGTHQSDGTIQIVAPLSFAPAGGEGMATFSVIVADDLGHQTQLSSSTLVDDEGPRITVDPNSLPTAAVIRGTHALLRVLLADEAHTSLQSAIDSGPAMPAAMQPDGSFRVDLDTSQAALDASTLTAHLTASDSLGNQTHLNVVIPITRLRWRSASPQIDSIVGLALTPSSVLATTQSAFVIVNRSSGARSQIALPGMAPTGNLAVDDDAAYTAITDGRICKLGLDGSVRWCCTLPDPLAGNIALGPFPGATSGAPMMPTLMATTRPSSSAGRLLAIRDLDASACDLHASLPIGPFLNSGPSVAPDSSVYAGAAQAAVVGEFDGLAWTVKSSALSQFLPSGEPAFGLRGPGDDSGQRVFFNSGIGVIDALLFPTPTTEGTPPGQPTLRFAARASPGQLSSTAPIGTEDGSAIVATYDPLLVAIAPNGSIQWSSALDGQLSSAPVAGAGGIIYAAAAAQGSFEAFSLADGGVQWKFPVGAPIATAPAPGCDGAIYLGTNAGDIISLAADAPGLANSPWPREGHDVRGTGDARRPLRDADGGCLE